MASTQSLTELPKIQYTGMDYTTVISQIKEIIESNKNWQTNWTEFYSSEAGTMLIQLMAWICDNLAVRQDLIYNENFLSTATSDKSKLRLLNQIGYVQSSATAAIIPLSIEFENYNTDDIKLSNCRDDVSSISEIVNKIFSFKAPNINGASTNYEILSINEDGTINYETPLYLKGGNSIYEEYYSSLNSDDETAYTIKAVEGKTSYISISSDTSDGPIFEIRDTNVDLKTIILFDLTNSGNNKINYKKVDSFMDSNVLNGSSNTICYIIERNDDGYLQVRFPSKELVTYGGVELSDRLFTAGNRVGILYRTTSGSLGNVPANYFNVSTTVTTTDGSSLNVVIKNTLAGSNGEDEESLSSAVSNGPLTLKTMNRAVTISDYDRILKNSDLVYSCKSYSPDNEPDEFYKFYGRRINPREVFSFVVLNKNYNDIPTSKFNLFPWVDLNKQPVINEKYVFGDATWNNQFVESEVYSNIYFEDCWEESYKHTESYYDHYYTTKIVDESTKKYEARMFRNLIRYSSSDTFSDTITSEKKSTGKYLSIVLTKEEATGNYIDSIPSQMAKLSVSSPYSENTNVSAKITSTNNLEDYINDADSVSAINVYQNPTIDFVIDDNFEVTVDLIEDAETGIGRYFLYFDNEPTEPMPSGKITAWYGSEEAAKYRKGIIQRIREKVLESVNYMETVEYTEPTGVKTTVCGTDIYYVDEGNKTTAYIGNNEIKVSDNEETDKLEAASLCNGLTSYVDIDVQRSTAGSDEEEYLIKDFNVGDYLTITIAGEQYSIQVNGTSFAAINSFYSSLQSSTETKYYDYHKYIGRGDLYKARDDTGSETLVLIDSNGNAVTENIAKLTSDIGITYFSRKEVTELPTIGDNDKTISLTIDDINTILCYLLSPFNKAGSEIFCEIVTKDNYTVNNITNPSNIKNNSFKDYKERDLRIVMLNSDTDKTITNSTISETDHFDLLDLMTGLKNKVYTFTPCDYIANYENTVTLDTEAHTFIIQSLKSGLDSRLYFINNSSNKNNAPFISAITGLTNGFNNNGNKYSNKAFGLRWYELFTGTEDPNDFDTDENANGSAVTYIGMPRTEYLDFYTIIKNANDITINVGDIIAEDNDLNYVNIQDLYFSYILSNSSELKLNKMENFYYSSDEETNEAAKPAIIGIEGQSVYEDEDGNHVIDNSKSDFGVKITDSEVETTSFYNIEDNSFSTLNNIIKNERVEIEVEDLKEDTTDDSTTTLSFYIDNNDENVISISDISVGIKGSTLYNKISEALTVAGVGSILKYVGNDDRFIICGEKNNDNGAITFLYTDENCKKLYKRMFGTNISNPNFYNLYSNILDEEEGPVIVDGSAKYFSPVSEDVPLSFKYRALIDENGTSKFGDYYIEASGNSFEDENGYSFKIKKTENSTFPDREFYVHFINDRTYEPNRISDEDTLNDYMDNYRITGENMVYLKPYFKTFDIVATIKYNTNYDSSTVEENVRAAAEKFRINNISDIEIGNTVTRSDVINTLTVDGVEGVYLDYFGYDYEDQETYPDKKYVLNMLDSSATDKEEKEETSKFYMVSILADDTSYHGLILTMEKANADKYSS